MSASMNKRKNNGDRKGYTYIPTKTGRFLSYSSRHFRRLNPPMKRNPIPTRLKDKGPNIRQSESTHQEDCRAKFLLS
jgi:hypothetical protein